MPEVNINYWAVLVAAVANMALGALWYSPLLFAKPWIAAMGASDEEMEEMKKRAPRAYILSFVAAFIMSFVLAHFVDYTRATTIAQGAQAGFWPWLGFVVTTGSAAVLFEGRPTKLWLINSGYYLVALLVMGVILAVWA